MALKLYKYNYYIAGLSMRTRTHCTHRSFERRVRERLRDAMKLGYAYADAYAILWKNNIASQHIFPRFHSFLLFHPHTDHLLSPLLFPPSFSFLISKAASPRTGNQPPRKGKGSPLFSHISKKLIPTVFTKTTAQGVYFFPHFSPHQEKKKVLFSL